MRYKGSTFLLVFIALLATFWKINATAATELEPADLVESAFNEITAELRDNIALYKDNSQSLQAMVERRVTAYFDFQRMTQIAAAKYWRSANDEQKIALTREFRTQLIRSYSNALLLYRNAKAKVLSEQINDKGRVMVKLEVKNERGQPITLFLLMEQSQNQWRIIDVNVEGVSIVISARSRFSEEIANKGLNGFIQTLSRENQRLSP
ncbi:MAG: phospholipid transport system substrate-binding protein [Cellvibrionaceae bacterium]|jgi:phospholipid transport system substrate-binding protein